MWAAYVSEALAASPKACLSIQKATGTAPNTSPSTSILDFLLPSYLPRPRFYSASSHQFSTSSSSATNFLPARAQTHASLLRRQLPRQPISRLSRVAPPSALRIVTTGSSFTSATSNSMAAQQKRHFSMSTKMDKTHTILNPQVDDSGNEMRLEITSRAAKRLAKVMEKDGNPRLALRIQVESGGCHGFQYLMSLVTLPDSLSTPGPTTPVDSEPPTIREDDTIFAYSPDGGEDANPAANSLAAPKIILDTPSLELLNGSKVDFTMELIGSQFKIVDNPLATSSCGCGTSFDIKV